MIKILSFQSSGTPTVPVLNVLTISAQNIKWAFKEPAKITEVRASITCHQTTSFAFQNIERQLRIFSRDPYSGDDTSIDTLDPTPIMSGDTISSSIFHNTVIMNPFYESSISYPFGDIKTTQLSARMSVGKIYLGANFNNVDTVTTQINLYVKLEL